MRQRKVELRPKLLIMSLILNTFAGGLLDKIMRTTLYGENARESVSGITGYLAYRLDNKRAQRFAHGINFLTLDPLHCLKACEYFERNKA